MPPPVRLCRRMLAICCAIFARSSRAAEPASPARLSGGCALPSPSRSARAKLEGSRQAEVARRAAGRPNTAPEPGAPLSPLQLIPERSIAAFAVGAGHEGGVLGSVPLGQPFQAWGAARHVKWVAAGAGLCGSALLIALGLAAWGRGPDFVQPCRLLLSCRCCARALEHREDVRAFQVAAARPARWARSVPCFRREHSVRMRYSARCALGQRSLGSRPTAHVTAAALRPIVRARRRCSRSARCAMARFVRDSAVISMQTRPPSWQPTVCCVFLHGSFIFRSVATISVATFARCEPGVGSMSDKRTKTRF